MMNREHSRKIDVAREWNGCDIVQMQQVDRLGRVVNGPAAVVNIFQTGDRTLGQRPFRMFISPFNVTRQTRFAVSIDRDVESAFVQVARKISNKKFSAAVPTRWNFDEWGSDQSKVNGCWA
jgi:hypothetical protein